jgi:hypothetical protein
MSTQAVRHAEQQTEPLVIPRQPSYPARDTLRSGVRALLAEGFEHREAMSIFREMFVDVAMEQSGRCQKKACARIKISRDGLRKIRARAKGNAL